MTTFPKALEWATDATFLSGPDVGQPTRVAPSLGEQRQGMIGGARFAATKFNATLGQIGDHTKLQQLAAMQEWSREDLATTVGGANIALSYVTGVRLSGSGPRAAYASGSDANDSSFAKFFRGYAGRFEPNPQAPAFKLSPLSACGAAPGEFLWTAPGNNIHLATSLSATTGTVAGAAQVVHYAPGSPTPYIWAYSDGTFARGATFTVGNPTSAPASMTAIPASSLGAPAGEFADNGGNIIVYCGTCTISGSTRFRLIHSTDGGVTWTANYTFPAGTLSAGLAWQAATNQFVCVFEDVAGHSAILLSATGASGWTQSSTATHTNWPTSALATRHKTTACVGHCIAKIFSPSYFSQQAGGIAYTFDLGVTWRYVFLAHGAQPSSIEAINGRFYVVHGGGTVFRSGILSYEDADIV